MYMSLKVLEALDVLRNAAENDFERHRLDVLIKDLTAPPTVETINDTHQKFNGITYRKNRNKHYSRGGLSLYREVYAYHYGEIPAEYEIHHKDLNPNNNDITNLQLLTKKEHRKIHNANYPEKEYICEYCGKTFYSKAPQPIVRFCSAKCASNYRYKFGVTYKKICPKCGKEFSSLVKRIKYCSPECANADKITLPQHVCPICGKIFKPKKSQTIYCSFSCSAKATSKKRCKHFVEYRGEKISLVEAAKKSGINYDTLIERFKKGETGERAVSGVLCN